MTVAAAVTKAAGRVVKWVRPKLYPKQEKAFFGPERIGTCEASTKSGKTHAAMVWLLEMALLGGAAGRNYWWVAPVYGQAKIAYRRLKRAIPTALRKCNDTEMTITLLNGAVIWFKSGEKPDNLYGEDVFAAVIDEASRMKAEAWTAVRSTLTYTRGPVRMIGNVKGRSNWFFALCRKAEAGEPGMSYMKITALDAVEAGVLERDEIEGAKRDLPDHIFRELYMAEPSDTGNNPFGYAHIKACSMDSLSTSMAVGFGWDLAKSVDWTVGIGLDRDGAVSAFERFQKPWEETITTIQNLTGKRPALVDSTGVGDPILEALQRRPGKASATSFEGFKFTNSSKQMLMEGLCVAIQQGKIRYPTGTIRAELESFEYSYTRTGKVSYAAPEGFHDDCVMALALAWHRCNIEAGIVPGGRSGKGGGRAAGRSVGDPRRYGRSAF